MDGEDMLLDERVMTCKEFIVSNLYKNMVLEREKKQRLRKIQVVQKPKPEPTNY
jgi:hypothetical protein